MRIEEITKKDLESILTAIMSVYESGIDICELSEDMKSRTPINKRTKESYITIVAGNIALLSRQLFGIDDDEMNAVSNKVSSILQDDNKDKIQIRVSILSYLLGVQQDALTAQLSDINTRAKAMNDAIQRLSNDMFSIHH
jgi:hypothetical protein